MRLQHLVVSGLIVGALAALGGCSAVVPPNEGDVDQVQSAIAPAPGDDDVLAVSESWDNALCLGVIRRNGLIQTERSCLAFLAGDDQSGQPDAQLAYLNANFPKPPLGWAPEIVPQLVANCMATCMEP